MALKELYTVVGQRIRDQREAHDMTQAVLSEKTKINRATISNIESGKQQVSLHYLFLIAKFLDCEVKDFLPQVNELNILPDESVDIMSEKLQELNLDEATKNSILEVLFKKGSNDK